MMVARNDGINEIVIKSPDGQREAEVTSEKRLKTDAIISNSVSMSQYTDSSLRYEEMTRFQGLNDSTFTTICSKSGVGFVYGCVINWTVKFVYFKVIVDGVTIIDLDYDVLIDGGAFALDEKYQMPRWIYAHRTSSANYGMAIEFPMKMKYNTSFEIQAKLHTGQTGSLDFGLVIHEV